MTFSVRRVLAAAALCASLPAFALEPLDEATLSSVSGQDGIEMDLNTAGSISLTQQKWITDSGAVLPTAANPCIGGTANRHACTILNNLALTGVSPAALHANAQLDVGSDNVSGVNNIGVSYVLDWDPLWLTASGLTLHTPTEDRSAYSIGSLAIRTDGYMKLFNRGGFLNAGGNFAQFDFSSGGDIIYRQGGAGSPELSFGNFLISNRFTNGAAGGHLNAYGMIGLDDQGLVVSAPYARADLLFDIMFKANPTVANDLTGRQSVTLFGWTGGLKDTYFRLAPGGISYNTFAATGQNVLTPATSYTFQGGGTRSEGLNITTQWNFDTDFTWMIGQAGGNRTEVRFTDWRRLGTTTTAPMLVMPVTIDIQQNNVGPAGLCLGGGFTSGVPVQASCTAAGGAWIAGGVPTGKAAFATQIRDAHLWAYNQKVEVRDPTQGPATQYDWSLLYTYGKLDADIYMYPEGRGTGITPSATATGIKLDATLTAQSPGFWEKANSTSAATRATAASNWDTNTHFMLVDTDVGGLGTTQFGIGLLNADLLWRARDMYLRVISGDGGYPDLPAGLWLQSDTGSRYFMRGLFGGGNLSNMSQPTAMALVSLDLSTNRFIFVMSPRAPVNGDAPIGFDALLDLDGTASLSMAEVANPTAAFRLYNVGGRVAWKNGTVNVISGQNTTSGLPQLTIANELLIGTSANFGSGGGAPLIGNAGFGTESYGRIILPGGNWYNEFSIKIPNT